MPTWAGKWASCQVAVVLAGARVKVYVLVTLAPVESKTVRLSASWGLPYWVDDGL